MAESRLSNLSHEQRSLQGLVDEMGRRKAEAVRQLEEQREKLGRALQRTERLRAKMGIAGQPQGMDIELAEVGPRGNGPGCRTSPAGVNATYHTCARVFHPQRHPLMPRPARRHLPRARLVPSHELRLPTPAPQLPQVRDVTRAMLLELKALAAANPGAGILEACEAAGVRLPSGSSAAGSTAGSRPHSARSQGSLGSARSGRSAGGASNVSMGSRLGAGGRGPAIRTIELGA